MPLPLFAPRKRKVSTKWYMLAASSHCFFWVFMVQEGRRKVETPIPVAALCQQVFSTQRTNEEGSRRCLERLSGPGSGPLGPPGTRVCAGGAVDEEIPGPGRLEAVLRLVFEFPESVSLGRLQGGEEGGAVARGCAREVRQPSCGKDWEDAGELEDWAPAAV